MRIRRPHVLHTSVAVAVLVQLGFATAFVVDATQTNRVYDTLGTHRVAITGHVRGCADVVTTRGFGTRFCRVGYDYQGRQFSTLLPSGQTTAFYVDPGDPSLRMSAVTFEKGPEETDGDLVLAGVLVLGASLVTVVHLAHLRRGRATRMHLRTDGESTTRRHPSPS